MTPYIMYDILIFKTSVIWEKLAKGTFFWERLGWP